jgi:hypothetical protein
MLVRLKACCHVGIKVVFFFGVGERATLRLFTPRLMFDASRDLF